MRKFVGSLGLNYATDRAYPLQIAPLMNNLAQVIFGHIAVTFYTVWLFAKTPSFIVAGLWGIAMLAVLVPTIAMFRHLRGQVHIVSKNGNTARKLVGMAAMRGMLWFVGLAMLFPRTEATTANHLLFVSFGMIIGGVFTYWALPLAALAFSTPIWLGSVIGLWIGNGISFSPEIFALSVIFMFFNFVALAHADGIRSQAEIALRLEKEQAVVNLLLRDFEDDGRDWLWQVDALGYLKMGRKGFQAAIVESTNLFENHGMIDVFALLAKNPEQRNAANSFGQALGGKDAFSNHELMFGEGENAIHISLTAKPMLNESGGHAGWHGVASNISGERKAQAHIEKLALQDSLTGLPNRIQVRKIMGELIARQDGNMRWLVYGDLDGFKHVNDTLGHAGGDHVLRELSKRFSATVKSADTVARIGGDEFIFLLDCDRMGIEVLWKRLVSVAQAPVIVEGQPQMVGLSLGIVQLADQINCVDETLRRADLALYNAKQHGRGTARFYGPEMDEAVQERRSLEKALRAAVANREFEMYYQPIYECGTDKLRSYEALLRWTHPQLGPMSPASFIPLAEECGLINEIGAWALLRSCIDAKSFQDGVGVSVNVSAIQLRSRRLLVDVTKALGQSGLPPHRLELEMTETALVENADSAEKLINDLKSLGVKLALDDFGTGYSSLSYLHRFKFDSIKIDRSFVQAYGDRHESRAVVDAIIMLAKQLGISTTAEGIETKEQYAVMTERGCNLAQGFLLGRPAPLQQRSAHVKIA